MSSFEVVLAPEAETDITDAFVWYRKRSALAADGFRVEVFDAIGQIGDAPLSWPVDDPGRVVHGSPNGSARAPDGLLPFVASGRSRQSSARTGRIHHGDCFPLSCPLCQVAIRIMALINEANTARQIPDHQGEPTRPPRIATAAGNDPHWALAAQPLPEVDFDQRLAG